VAADWKSGLEEGGKLAAIIAALTIPLIDAGMFAGTKAKIFGDDVKRYVNVPGLEGPVAGDPWDMFVRLMTNDTETIPVMFFQSYEELQV
jgi:hypothetical protein